MEISKKKQWCVLEFHPREQGGVVEVGTLPISWTFLKDDIEFCYYPKKPQAHLVTKFVREYVEPDTGKWDAWVVKKTLGTFGDLDTARAFEEHSTQHSDVDENFGPLSKKQRAARHKKVWNTESDSEPSNHGNEPIPPPPVLAQKGAKIVNNIDTSNSATKSTSLGPAKPSGAIDDELLFGESSRSVANFPPMQEDELPPPLPPQTPAPQPVLQELQTPSQQKKDSSPPELINLSTPKRLPQPTRADQDLPTYSSPLAQFSNLTAPIDIDNYSDILSQSSMEQNTPNSTRNHHQEQCICGMSLCKRRDYHLRQYQREVARDKKLDFLVSYAEANAQAQKKARMDEDRQITRRYKFPISTVDSFNKLNEEMLTNKDSANEMISFFKSCSSSSSAKESCYDILPRLLTSEVAMNYNWENRFGTKLPMRDLPFHKLIFEALRQKPNVNEVSLVAIQTHLKEWCRQAKSRTSDARDVRRELAKYKKSLKNSNPVQENLENTRPTNGSSANVHPTSTPSQTSPQSVDKRPQENQDTSNNQPGPSNAEWFNH